MAIPTSKVLPINEPFLIMITPGNKAIEDRAHNEETIRERHYVNWWMKQTFLSYATCTK